MQILNVEIKARCDDPDRIRSILNERGARFAGRDHQVDTYFSVDEGRLKLREGDIENALIFYRRSDVTGPKTSDVRLYRTGTESGLKSVLQSFLATSVVVDKIREIYFVENVKFHIDRVEKLGSFVEIEAISEEGAFDEAYLREQCTFYLDVFGIEEADLQSASYSDMLRECEAL